MTLVIFYLLLGGSPGHRYIVKKRRAVLLAAKEEKICIRMVSFFPHTIVSEDQLTFTSFTNSFFASAFFGSMMRNTPSS